MVSGSADMYPQGYWDYLESLETKMNRFTVYRPVIPEDTHDEFQANDPDEPQFEGIVFSDGTCVIRWLTVISTSVFESFDAMLIIHGHPEYDTRVVFHDEVLPLPWVSANGIN